MATTSNQIAAIKASNKKANNVSKSSKTAVTKAAAKGTVKPKKEKVVMLLDWKEDVLGLNRKYKDQTLSQVLSFLNKEKTVKNLLPAGSILTPAFLRVFCPELLKDKRGNDKAVFNGPFTFLKALRKSDKESIALAFTVKTAPVAETVNV